MYTIEKATLSQLDACWEIILDGKRFQNEQGFVQWTDDYPTFEMIRSDIENENGYVLKRSGDIAAFMFLGFEGEPTYEKIDGKWSSDEPYAVMHKMAVSSKFRGRGLSGVAFNLIEELCKKKGFLYLRGDTFEQNKLMQHVFQKNGFSFCGEISFNGNKLFAFDKVLEK